MTLRQQLDAMPDIPLHPDYDAYASWHRETARADFNSRRCEAILARNRLLAAALREAIGHVDADSHVYTKVMQWREVLSKCVPHD